MTKSHSVVFTRETDLLGASVLGVKAHGVFTIPRFTEAGILFREVLPKMDAQKFLRVTRLLFVAERTPVLISCTWNAVALPVSLRPALTMVLVMPRAALVVLESPRIVCTSIQPQLAPCRLFLFSAAQEIWFRPGLVTSHSWGLRPHEFQIS